MNNPEFIPVGQQMLAASLAHIAEHRAELEKGGSSAWAYQLLVESAEKKHKDLEHVVGLFIEHGEGLQLRHKKNEQWAILLPDATEEGKFRYQIYCRDGFWTHRTYNTWEETVEEVAKDGFLIEANGSFDALASTLTWARGIEIGAVLQASNAGLIDWKEYLLQTQEIHLRYAALDAAQQEHDLVDDEDVSEGMSMR